MYPVQYRYVYIFDRQLFHYMLIPTLFPSVLLLSRMPMHTHTHRSMQHAVHTAAVLLLSHMPMLFHTGA